MPPPQETRLSVYPNPFAEYFILQCDNYKQGNAKIVITSQSGVVVETREFVISTSQNKTEFNLSAQPAGIYFIKVMTGEGVQVMKAEKLMN